MIIIIMGRIHKKYDDVTCVKHRERRETKIQIWIKINNKKNYFKENKRWEYEQKSKSSFRFLLLLLLFWFFFLFILFKYFKSNFLLIFSFYFSLHALSFAANENEQE
jgi:hypothetical protein